MRLDNESYFMTYKVSKKLNMAALSYRHNQFCMNNKNRHDFATFIARNDILTYPPKHGSANR